MSFLSALAYAHLQSKFEELCPKLKMLLLLALQPQRRVGVQELLEQTFVSRASWPSNTDVGLAHHHESSGSSGSGGERTTRSLRVISCVELLAQCLVCSHDS